METQNNIDVLIEVGGIYGDGNVNVTARKGLVHMVVDYDLNEKDLSQHEYAELESEVSDIRKALLSPAPIDWAKEVEKIAEMYKKAQEYIVSAVAEHGEIYLSDFPITDANGENVEVYEVAWGGMGDDPKWLLLLDVEGEEISTQTMSHYDWLLLAESVQKAIAGK